MTFLAPIVLAGLAAVGAPVAIHLLNKMRVKIVKWGATRFLNSAIKKNERRVRIEDLLLLALRCLLVAMLVLAFARPVINPGGAGPEAAGNSSRVAVLVLDDSASMSQSNGVETRFDSARASAGKALDELGPGSQAALFLVTDRVSQIVPRPTENLALVRRSLDISKPSDRTSDLLPAVRQAIETLRPVAGANKEVLVFTDNQALAWAQIDALKPLLAENPEVRVRVIPAGEHGEDNLAVSAIKPESLVPAVGQLFGCLVEISNWGTAPVNGVRVTLSLDGGAPSDEAVIERIDSGQSRSVRLNVRFSDAGYHTLGASIPPDRMPADNERALALQVVDQVRVAVVEGTAAAQKQDRDGFFLTNALMPVPESRRADYFLKAQAHPLAWLDDADLSREEIIFLSNVGKLSPAVSEKLKKYVLDGGSLVIFPGPNVTPPDYNDNSALRDILPAAYEAERETGKSGDDAAWQSKDYRHPVTALWNETKSSSLGSVRTAHYFPLRIVPGKTGDEAPQTIVSYANGTPAAVDRKAGKGRVVMFGSSATTKWTNFPIHPNFVPFLKRLTGYLTQVRNPANLNLLPGSVFQQVVSPDLAGREFLVLRPDADGKQRSAGTVERADRSGLVRYRDTEKAGAYRLLLANDNRPLAAFAIQMDPAESNLRVEGADRLAFLNAGQSAAGKVEAPVSAGVRREFWTLLVLLAFLVALAEMVLAYRFSLSK